MTAPVEIPPIPYDVNGVNAAFTVYDEFMARYAKNTDLFFIEVLEITPYEWQHKVNTAYDCRARRIAIKSGHGVGKGYEIAGLAVHHILTRYPQKTLLTAPSAGQLYDAAWNDIKIFIQKLPPMLADQLEVFADKIELKASPNESFITARTSRPDQPEAMQGIRSSGSTLILCDEASGIADSVFEAASGSMSGNNVTLVLTGNPIRNSGYFFDAFHRLASQFVRITVSCYDIPHISPDYIEDMKARYGEDSARFAYRVLGEFPKADEDTVIPAYLAEGAKLRDVKANPFAPIVWGLDCARTGNDRSALAKRQGNVVLEPIKTWRIPDLMLLVGKVLAEFKTTPVHLRPAEICVDSIGLGAGVVDRLREMSNELPGVMIRAVNVAEAPAVLSTERYLNLRAELWYEMREWLLAQDCQLPNDDVLISELVSPRQQNSSNGKLKVESKEDMKKRGMPSPDAADALMMTFAASASRMRAGSRGGGSGNATFADYTCPYV